MLSNPRPKSTFIIDLHKLQKLHIIRRNGGREATEKPLNRHNCDAGCSADAAERRDWLAYVRRVVSAMPLQRM